MLVKAKKLSSYIKMTIPSINQPCVEQLIKPYFTRFLKLPEQNEPVCKGCSEMLQS
jgi:hypothetical protein